jgi:hypothetical protein
MGFSGCHEAGRRKWLQLAALHGAVMLCARGPACPVPAGAVCGWLVLLQAYLAVLCLAGCNNPTDLGSKGYLAHGR